MLSTPEFWVAVSFVLFVALMLKFGVPSMLARALDKRAVDIRAELEEAQKLREEAQAVLAEYQRKRRDAESEASDIITLAKEEAERLAAETRVKLEESLERRLKMAELKISQAEIQAEQDVRAITADAAIKAAESVIAAKMTSKAQADLVAESIKELKSKFN
ncbi:MAG: ATP F0F1 synthase subunit B [Fimbriimonadaceae bacterium]|nr:ATP F0F1 synthase subunit B [Alphaproteobacteria bacterium]